MKLEFELGFTQHSQRVTLIVDKTGQRPAYAITKHAANQRDLPRAIELFLQKPNEIKGGIGQCGKANRGAACRD